MEFSEVIRLRRSTRAFTDQQVSDADLQKVLDAAQLAPIAGGQYSMSHITVVQDKALLDKIRTACSFQSKHLDPLYGAPTLIVLSATGPSSDCIEYSNVACAIENMTLAAADLGLGSVYLWGFLRKLRNQPELLDALQLPDGYTPLSAMALGHPAEPSEPREPKPNIGVNRI